MERRANEAQTGTFNIFQGYKSEARAVSHTQASKLQSNIADLSPCMWHVARLRAALARSIRLNRSALSAPEYDRNSETSDGSSRPPSACRYPAEETDVLAVMEISESTRGRIKARRGAVKYRRRNARNKVRRITVYLYKRRKAFRFSIAVNAARLHRRVSPRLACAFRSIAQISRRT